MNALLKLSNDSDVYYNPRYALSREAFMIVSIGGRGIGKTTGWLIEAVKKRIKRGEEFIYCRRYKPELKAFESKNTLDTIVDNVTIQKDGLGGSIYKIGDDTIGYGIALSVANAYKSADFSRVGMIIYDEAVLPPKSPTRYLPNEMTTLLEFVSTVYRTRTKGRVVILGNNLDLFNPYFNYYSVPLFEEKYFDKKRGLYCELCKNSPKLLEMERKTPLYKLIEGTQYGEYHYENKPLLTKDYLVIRKPSNCSLQCRILVNDNEIAIYLFTNKEGTHMYVETCNKIIKDNITYEIYNKGVVNYIAVQLYKRKIKNFVGRYYFSDNIAYSDEKAGAIMTWVTNNL